MPRSLYICYFGMREPLVQTQVLPYLREIIKDGIRMSLLTFEPNLKAKWTQKELETEKSKLSAQGIDWHYLAYHKSPSTIATAYDVLRGVWLIRQLIHTDKVDILHGRVHLPTLMAALARKISSGKPRILFDIRGFFPEEYTDAGIWPDNGWLYRSAKRVERWLLKQADGFVVLTEQAREILFPESIGTGFDSRGRPVEVIPCCVDLKRFERLPGSRTEMRKKHDIEDRYVIAYIGSFGGWYLTDEMIDFFTFAKANDPTTFVLILTQRDKDKIAERLKQNGFLETDFLVKTVGPEEIKDYLNAADYAISFIKACYSKKSSSPTKIAEYLACGLPIVANRGVGDLDNLIEGKKVGVMIDDFTRESFQKAVDGIKQLNHIGQRCRQTARIEFDLEDVGGTRYRSIYNKLLQ